MDISAAVSPFLACSAADFSWPLFCVLSMDMSFLASGEDSSFFSAFLSFSSAAASGELSGLDWDEWFIRMPPLFMPVYASRDRK